MMNLRLNSMSAISARAMDWRMGAVLLLMTGVPWMAWQHRHIATQAASAAQLAAVGEVCVVAPPQAYDPASGIAMDAPRPIPADARCPVCGMYPARSGVWAAQVIFNNGDAQFFDSPLTLWMYLHDVGRYSRGRHAAEITASYVHNMAGAKADDQAHAVWINAASAWYVHGSDALGPMRAGNLPAFSTQEEARHFVELHGGRMLDAAHINAPLLQALSGARRHHLKP